MAKRKISDKVYRFDIITDPDDPTVTKNLKELLSLVEGDNFILTDTNLDRGLVRYTIDTITNNNDNPDIINRIDQLVGEVSYVPITVSMNVSMGSNNMNNNNGSIITGASEIVKTLTSDILNINIRNVETMRHNDIIIFTPITEELTSVYENPKYLGEYHRLVNLDILGGYQVLSEDPLVRYVLSELYRGSNYVPSDIKAIYVHNIALIPVGNDNDEENHYNKIKNRVGAIIEKKRQDGYFTYKLSIHNISDILLLNELASLWNSHIVYNEDNINIVIKHDEVDFGTDPEMWFRYNIDIIKRGQFPSITLYGRWQFDVRGDYNQIYDRKWNQAILQYGSLLAYRKLGLKDSLIQPFTHTIKVNNDLSITLSLPTYTHVILFKEYFNDIFNGYQGLEHNGDQSWLVEPCEDLIDGVIKRWYIQGIDKRSMPMVLKNESDGNGTEEILVFRSPAIGLYSPNNDPFDLKNIDIKTIRNNLTDSLREYYVLCHDNIEPVLLDHINKMELSDLLDLIEIKERPNQPTYCYSKNTILSLENPINPITQRPLQDNIIQKALLVEWGLRGLFDVGPLTGLYEDLPQKILVSPKVGLPMIAKVVTNPIQQNIIGDVYLVSVGFQDGNITDMFEIANETPNDLKRIVEQLWNNGFFLNYWISAVQEYSNELKSFVVIITSPLLLQGSYSKINGLNAIKYLEEAVNKY